MNRARRAKNSIPHKNPSPARLKRDFARFAVSKIEMKSQRATANAAERKQSRSEADTGQCFGPWVGLCFSALRVAQFAATPCGGLQLFRARCTHRWRRTAKSESESLIPRVNGRPAAPGCGGEAQRLLLAASAFIFVLRWLRPKTNRKCFCGSSSRAGRTPPLGRDAQRLLLAASTP